MKNDDDTGMSSGYANAKAASTFHDESSDVAVNVGSSKFIVVLEKEWEGNSFLSVATGLMLSPLISWNFAHDTNDSRDRRRRASVPVQRTAGRMRSMTILIRANTSAMWTIMWTSMKSTIPSTIMFSFASTSWEGRMKVSYFKVQMMRRMLWRCSGTSAQEKTLASTTQRQ